MISEGTPQFQLYAYCVIKKALSIMFMDNAIYGWGDYLTPRYEKNVQSITALHVFLFPPLDKSL